MVRIRFTIRGLMVVVAIAAVNAALMVPLMRLVNGSMGGGRTPLMFLPFILGLDAFGFAFYLVSREVWKMEGGMRVLWMTVLVLQGFAMVGFWTLIQFILFPGTGPP